MNIKDKLCKKNLYFTLLTLLPLINIFIVSQCLKINKSVKEFKTSIIQAAIVFIICLILGALLYSLILMFSFKYNKGTYFRVITGVYSLISLLAFTVGFTDTFLKFTHTYSIINISLFYTLRSWWFPINFGFYIMLFFSSYFFKSYDNPQKL